MSHQEKPWCVALSLEVRGVQQLDLQFHRSDHTPVSAAPRLEAISCLPKQAVQTHLSGRELRTFPQAEKLHRAAWLGLLKVWCSSGFWGGLSQAGPEHPK